VTEQPRPETSVRPGFARDDWNARYAQKEYLWTAAPNRRFAEEVAGLAPGRALDLACGEGRNAVWLAERGWEVTGVDFSDVALVKAAQLATSRGVEVEWVVADVLDDDPVAGAFDLVVVLYLQLPREAMLRAIRGAASAVAPGGTLLVLGHDSANIADGHGGPKDPAVLYTADDLVPVLEGLTVEHAGPVRRTVVLDQGGEAVAIDALVRARRPV
jgi:SAM-dependent methyltransferase